MPDAKAIDTTPWIIRLVALHVVLVALPVLLVALAVGLRISAIVVALLVGGVVTFLRIRGTDDRTAAALGATPTSAADEPRLFNVAESVAMAAGVPMPELSIIESPAANSVTWGAGSGPAHLALTRGLLDAADRVELEAVLGHHTALVRTGVVDAVTLGSSLFSPLARGPLQEPLASLVTTGLDPRSIVLADLDGVRATRYPPGLVAALSRLQALDTTVAAVPAGLSGLCFAAPHRDGSVFDFHPPIEDRIDLLREV